ncbi:hypothetical protein M409DRAFT_54867 [Zasmidium cellare ATCC 36951]|uniref:Uncharacterized protein n=1 Tax=Zasmidium cellare ATCC 36951 TaxID=1080233 RepID=A0A6A6CH10_ZASCE|nr:uncharacterized protein M409DRAFT_54867 [Zasmidium cellare ATCC 36951]KAF2166527.1 hypothetical protein M409DRAFT_54867 [Zasmidium cellare ATCC 36951]
MSPDHDTALENANLKDFILVERSPTRWFLLFIATFDLNPLDGVRILVKHLPEPSRRDLWNYQRYGTWVFEIQSSELDLIPMSVLTQRDDIFTAKPSVEKLKELMGGGCLFDGCEDGLVTTNGDTQLAVPWRRSLERIIANGPGREAKTLCPFCMGWELFERHEHLANAWTIDRYPVEVERTHREAINEKREQLGCERLLPGIQLSTLTFGVQRARPNHPARARVPVTKTPEPELSTHLFGWFKHAQERVLGDGCAICREKFQDGESIADLPSSGAFALKTALYWHRGRSHGNVVSIREAPKVFQNPISTSNVAEWHMFLEQDSRRRHTRRIARSQGLHGGLMGTDVALYRCWSLDSLALGAFGSCLHRSICYFKRSIPNVHFHRAEVSCSYLAAHREEQAVTFGIRDCPHSPLCTTSTPADVRDFRLDLSTDDAGPIVCPHGFRRGRMRNVVGTPLLETAGLVAVHLGVVGTGYSPHDFPLARDEAPGFRRVHEQPRTGPTRGSAVKTSCIVMEGRGSDLA